MQSSPPSHYRLHHRAQSVSNTVVQTTVNHSKRPCESKAKLPKADDYNSPGARLNAVKSRLNCQINDLDQCQQSWQSPLWGEIWRKQDQPSYLGNYCPIQTSLVRDRLSPLEGSLGQEVVSVAKQCTRSQFSDTKIKRKKKPMQTLKKYATDIL